MVARCEHLQPGQALILIGDKYRGKDFETELAKLEATIMRPRRKDSQDADRTSPRSASGSSRSSKPARTSSRSSATARVLSNLRVRLCARFSQRSPQP